jgi:transcriptional regulator with XRE-family HTH domain
MSIGAIANTLRKARGLSLSDIEQLTGINKGALSKFERNIEGLGQDKLDKLCVTFNTTPSVLYALSRAVQKNPEMLENSDKLYQTVCGLTRLIDHYLQASDAVRAEVDNLLASHFSEEPYVENRRPADSP